MIKLEDLRGHWARPWILTAVRAGVLDAYPNHTFQPGAVVKRAELADAQDVVQEIGERHRCSDAFLTYIAQMFTFDTVFY